MTIEYTDIIERVARRLTPTQVEMACQVITNYTAGSGVLYADYNNPAFPRIRPGTILACGLNVFYVLSITNSATGELAVIGGYQGSTDANITASATNPSATLVIAPRFTRWDISQNINDELNALSSRQNGLGQILGVNLTYNPAFMGYDLGDTFDSTRSQVLEVNYREPLPWKRDPRVRRGTYRVIRSQDTSGDFPSGNGIILYQRAWPGFPIRVTFLAPFGLFVNLTDTITSVGLPEWYVDIVEFGVTLRLAPDREIQRNSMSSQPDPRKAQEVPPNAIQSSGNSLMLRYRTRINEERATLRASFPHGEV